MNAKGPLGFAGEENASIRQDPSSVNALLATNSPWMGRIARQGKDCSSKQLRLEILFFRTSMSAQKQVGSVPMVFVKT